MEKQTPLAKLEPVELTKYWKSEPYDFTPWLAENISLLGEAIGLELEVEAQEKDVGPFRADILCKDLTSENWVLIENQLNRTDHTHLGQLLTYAAGLQAVTIIWVARNFCEEHRAALDWLNEITDEDFNFFGVEVELWKIGDSPFAPKFNLVSRPNDWTKSVQRSARAQELTETGQMQLGFWTEFKKYMEEHSTIRCPKPAPQSWVAQSIGRSGFLLGSVASTWDSIANTPGDVLRAELIITNNRASDYFDLLRADKEAIEREIGEALIWYNPESAKQCRIYLQKNVDLRDRKRWPEYHEWLKQRLEKIKQVFAPRVLQLRLPDERADTEL